MREKFIDRFGDVLEVTPDKANVYVYLESWSDDRTEVNDFAFKLEDAKELARCILRMAGEEQPGVQASKLSYNEAALRLAAIHQVPATFLYRRVGGDTERRQVIPHRATGVQDRGDHFLVRAHDLDRDDFRQFRSDRIEGRVQIG